MEARLCVKEYEAVTKEARLRRRRRDKGDNCSRI